VKATHHSSFLSVLLEEFPSVVEKMFSDDDLLPYAAIAIALKKEQSNKKKSRSRWSKEWYLKRECLSHTNLVSKLRLEPDDWLNYLRMDEDAYWGILQKVTPLIKKSNTVMRKAITPHERLSVTLRFLATVRSYADLRFPAAISPQALSLIIPETCKAIYEELKEEYLRVRKRLLIE
jgi:hypothetical protein